MLLAEGGNYICGQGSAPHDHLVGWLTLQAVPAAAPQLTMTGRLCPEPIGGTIRGQVRIKDQVIYEGLMNFAERELTRQKIEFAPEVLQDGINRLEIRNIAPNGRAGGRPWFGVAAV